MSCDSPMTLLGTFSGRKFYLAEEGRFTRPGIYFWDGKNNVHVDDAITRPTPEGAVEKMRNDIGILLATIDNYVEAAGEPLSPCDAAMVEQIRDALSLSGKQGEAVSQDRATQDQVAAVMLQHGTHEQQREALEYALGKRTPTPHEGLKAALEKAQAALKRAERTMDKDSGGSAMELPQIRAAIAGADAALQSAPSGENFSEEDRRLALSAMGKLTHHEISALHKSLRISDATRKAFAGNLHPAPVSTAPDQSREGRMPSCARIALAASIWDAENTSRFSELSDEDRQPILDVADSIMRWLGVFGWSVQPSDQSAEETGR